MEVLELFTGIPCSQVCSRSPELAQVLHTHHPPVFRGFGATPSASYFHMCVYKQCRRCFLCPLVWEVRGSKLCFHVLLTCFLLFSRHLLGCLEGRRHSSGLCMQHVPSASSNPNQGQVGSCTNKNRCYTWSQPKGAAVEAGCLTKVGGIDFVQMFLWYSVIQQWPGGWCRDCNEHLLFEVQDGLFWQIQKWGVEQGNRESMPLQLKSNFSYKI